MTENSVAGDAPRAVLYLRVSDAEQAKGYSLRQQREALEAWCEAEGFEVLGVCEDPGVSGTHLNRGGLDRARDLVRAGGVDAVVAQDRDRFAREPAYLYLLKEEFGCHGTRLHALNSRGDGSPEGQLTDGILDQLAKFERAKLLERTRRGTERKLKEGRLVRRGRRPPFGFGYSEDGGSLVVDVPEMAVVRRLFRMVGAEGLSLHAAARALNDDGVPSPGGGRWNTTGRWKGATARHIVQNDIYRPLSPAEAAEHVTPEVAAALPEGSVFGMWVFGRRHQERWQERDEAEPTGYRTRYRVSPRPPEEWRRVPIPLDGAGLERALVEAARERARDVKKRPASEAGGRLWVLSGGIARCASCGHNLSPTGGGRHGAYYRCVSRYSEQEGRTCDARRTPSAEKLEEAVWMRVRDLMKNPGVLFEQYEQHVERRKRQLRGDPDRETNALAERLEKLERRRDGFMEMRADGDISREEYRRKLAELDGEREGVRKALGEAKNRGEELRRLGSERELVLETFQQLAKADLNGARPEERRRILMALGVRADVDLSGPEVRVHITGVFDRYIVDLLPFSKAPRDRPYRRSSTSVIYDASHPEVTLTTIGRSGSSPPPEAGPVPRSERPRRGTPRSP